MQLQHLVLVGKDVHLNQSMIEILPFPRSKQTLVSMLVCTRELSAGVFSPGLYS
jgi:hypothetical protein